MQSPLNTQLVYRVVAETLPMEGRDFSLDLSRDASGQSIRITPLTPIGRSHVPHLQSALASALSGYGVQVVTGGVEARTRAEENAAAQQEAAESDIVHNAILRSAASVTT